MSRLRFAWRSLAKAPLLSLVDSDRRVGDGSSGGTAVGAIYRDAVVRREGGRRDSGGRRGAGVDGDGDCGGVPAGAPPKIARGLVGHATTDSKTVSWQSLLHQKLFTPATPLFIKYLQAIDNLRTPFSHTRCAILNTVEEVRRRKRLRHQSRLRLKYSYARILPIGRHLHKSLISMSLDPLTVWGAGV